MSKQLTKKPLIINLPKWCMVSITKGADTLYVEFDKVEIGYGYFKFLRTRQTKINRFKPYKEAKNNNLFFISIAQFLTDLQKKEIISRLNLSNRYETI